MAETISWAATVATIVAAFMTASNISARVTGYGFAVFTIGALCWIADGVLSGQPALTWTNVVLTLLDVFGVWRWLGRQSRVEEGGRAASEASERTPGSCCSRSRSARAPIMCGSAEVGHCIDAMAGCRSGTIEYVVVSEGGVAGVGERLRRLPWGDAHVDGETVIANFEPGRFEQLQELQRINGRGADRHRRNSRRGISPGSRDCVGSIIRRTGTGARAPDDLPRVSTVRGGGVAVKAGNGGEASDSERDDCRIDGPGRRRRVPCRLARTRPAPRGAR